MRVIRLAILAFLCLIWITGAVGAQDASNLLTNPGFEEGSFGPYTQRRGGEKPIYLPNGWNAVLPAAQRGDYYERADRVTINPHPETGFPKPLKGTRALSVDCGFVTCTVSVYQTVSTGITPGANVRAEAWAQVKACNLPKDDPGLGCGSAVESGAKTRIGIDPNGGSDPNDADIVWSGFISPHEQGGWQKMTVDATATGNAVTLFLYSTQQNFSDINITYWDEAALAGGGSGGAAPSAATAVPTAPPQVAFVVPQAPQDDGSIVHTVQAGDTVDSIAFAYGVTRTQILELNNLASARFIQPGQKLIVKTAEPPATGNGAAGTERNPPADTPPETAPDSGETFEEVVGTLVPADVQAAPPEQQPPAQAAQPTEPPAPTQLPQPAPVTEVASSAIDPAATTGSVCVMLFDDQNQNRIQESGEAALAGGTINLSQAGQPVESIQTDGAPDPHCFADLSMGDYVAVASAPSGYGLTTANQFRVQLSPGATINVAFGAAQGVQPAAPPPADAGGLTQETASQPAATPSLADQLMSVSGLIVIGLAALVLIGGLGLALVMRRR
ncbi:MAG: LysM peptidoglycan-binding domain-containing protein [Chloroflexi bacterium]|nr:LysM peptidoglycan-binding domain-containing protein [Chloroflexota bacterium]